MPIDSEETFSRPESIDFIEEARQPFIDVEKKIVGSLLADIPDGARVLEVGMGTGELRKLIPSRLEVNFIQTDRFGVMVAEGKKRNPESKAAVSNVYDLAFANESMDAVVSLSAYDVFENMESALGETMRVLKHGGTFIHLVDFNPSSIPVIHELSSKGVPFPYLDAKDRLIGFYLVDTSNVNEVVKQAHPKLKGMVQHYIDKPDEIFYVVHSKFNQADQLALLRTLSLSAMTATNGEGETILLNDYFLQRMGDILENLGAKLTRNGRMADTAIVDKNQKSNMYPLSSNYLSNEIGFFTGVFNGMISEKLGPNKVLTEATILATKAIKQ